MQSIKTEVLVIGAGIVGCFTALRLAQQGLSVCLVDKGPIFREASGRNGGGVRQQYRDKAELPLAMKAIQIWAGLHEELDQSLEYRRQGSIRLIRSLEDLQQAQDRVNREKSMGLEVELLNASETRRLVPCLAQDMHLFGATFCASDGTANPLLLGQALLPILRNAGVNIRMNESVVRLTAEGKQILEAQSQHMSYQAQVYVMTAGPWSLKLCESAGLNFPITNRKSQLLVTEPLSATIRGFISFDKGYIRQAADGNFHLGIRGEPLSEIDKNLNFKAFFYAGRYFPEVFPFLRHVNIIRGFTGITSWTPDAIPIIDQAPNMKNLLLATGFSGHGFCLGPLVGQLITEWILNGQSSMDLTAFAWNRFAQDEQKKS